MAVVDPGREPVRLEAALDADLTRAEVGIYLTTVGAAEGARAIEERAGEADLVSRVRRARLLRSDVFSRRGELEEALRMQIETLTEAELDADRMACARAHCLLAGTYDRLAEQGKALQSAEECVRLLAPTDPPTWRAEHMNVLALATSYWRHGDVDYTTFEEAVRLAREAGDPCSAGDPQQLRLRRYHPRRPARGRDDRGAARTSPNARCLAATLGLARHDRRRPDGRRKARRGGRVHRGGGGSRTVRPVEPTTVVDVHPHAGKDRACPWKPGSRCRARDRRLWRLRATAGAGEAIGRTLEELSELAAIEGDYKRAYEYLRERNETLDSYQTERSEFTR